MTAEARAEWVCTDCGMRVYNACGDPIPQPKNWADVTCPHCRVNQARAADGTDAANELSQRLGLSKRARLKSEDAPKEDPGPTVTHAQREQIEAELRATFDPDTVIADRAGVSIRVVQTLRDELGIKPSSSRRREARRAAIGAAITEHPDWSNKEIAKALGTTAAYVKKDRDALGLPVPPSQREVRRRQIESALRDGSTETDRELSQRYHTASKTVRRIRQGLGLPGGKDRAATPSAA